MDKILLNNMAFFGTHGVLQEEKTLGQKFFIDAELYLDLKDAGKTDDLTMTVSYADVYEIIKTYAQDKCYDLLEALGENICNCILKNYKTIKEINNNKISSNTKCVIVRNGEKLPLQDANCRFHHL